MTKKKSVPEIILTDQDSPTPNISIGETVDDPVGSRRSGEDNIIFNDSHFQYVESSPIAETAQHKSTTTLETKGRKPRGGKLIVKSSVLIPTDPLVENIILHLKCSLNDLDKYNEQYSKKMTDPLAYIPNIPPEIQTYDTTSNINPSLRYSALIATTLNTTKDNQMDKTTVEYMDCMSNGEYVHYAYSSDGGNSTTTCRLCKQNMTNNQPLVSQPNSLLLENIIEAKTDATFEIGNNNAESSIIEVVEQEKECMASINQKLMNLKIQFLKNKINDKKSACFWCSYGFENPECYIPIFEVDNSLCGYGSFCCPECAVAYLMKEPIDDTTKFERYNLINQLYGKIFGYKKNVKPAPNPFYLLDKYYGSLTIEEYRKLLKSNHLLMIVDKPLTRIFPELHEETDNYDFLSSNDIHEFKIPTTTTLMTETQYKVKKNSDIQHTKSKVSIIQEHFGI
jgi:hypothetical protein